MSERHFSAVWYVSMAHVAIVLLPLEWLGVERWPLWMGYLSVYAFGWFLSAEIAAGGGLTKTRWLFRQVPERYIRVPLGIVMALAMHWRFPDWWLFDLISWGFDFWLPVHYWRRGMLGPVDHVVMFLGRLIGLDHLLEQWKL